MLRAIFSRYLFHAPMELILDSLIALDSDGLHLSRLSAEESHIEPMLNNFFAREQGFLNLPKLKAQVLQVKKVAEKFKGRFSDIVVLGIGGSALGVTCLRDALKGVYWNHIGSPRMFVMDNLDTVSEIEKIVDLDKTLFIVISKSGSTAETMAQYFYFKDKVSKENFVFITDSEEGELRAIGEEFGIPMLDIPRNVGGRFSVLTPVGLFPAALLGIDIEEILKGAEEMSDAFTAPTFAENLPFQMAAIQYLMEWHHGVHITALWSYSSRLSALGEWYRQLLAESIGKEGKGLTPMKALGVTDQHSLLQLFNEGPKDKLVCFIEVEKEEGPVLPRIDNPEFHYLSRLSFHDLMNTEKRGTERALYEYKKPSITIRLPEISAREVGKLIMFFECSIAFLGEYYKINAFDQPAVAFGKKITRELLS